MVLIAGGQAKLDFSITGDPAPAVQWLQNGEPLADGDGIATVKADVSFSFVDYKNHCAIYWCNYDQYIINSVQLSPTSIYLFLGEMV